MVTLRLLGGASLDGPNGPVTGRAALRHRLALLALLAVEHPRPLSRDKLLAYFWPESATDDARHLLRSSLYILRSALAEDSVLSTGEDLRLNPDRLTCDLWEFEAALVRNDLEQAVGVYHGPFLSGFHLAGAEDFQHWADGQRARLAGQYHQVLERLAERDTQRGNPLEAVRWWSRLAGEDPYNSRIALRYMLVLEAAGDRAAALRHASAHAELLRADLDAAPDADVIAFAERLRLESRPAANGAPTRPLSGASPMDPGVREESRLPPAAPMPARSARRGLLAPVAVAVVVVLGLGLLGGSLTRARSPVLTAQRVAAAPFENRTGRPDLDALGPLAADWIIRGAMETPMLGSELEAVYARGEEVAGRPTDPIAIARQVGAEKVIRGSYYLSGDSVLFLAGVMDVGSGRMLRSFDPVGAPLDRAIDALESLRERIAVGLGPLVNVFSRGTPVDPDLVSLPSLPAYREFVAGVKSHRAFDGEAAAEHWRRAAELDSTFVAPLIQLAYDATWFWEVDEPCSRTDSIGIVLEPRRDQLTAWDRLTIDLLRAYCRGDVAEAVDLLGARFEAYPRSSVARVQYAMALEGVNQPRAGREILLSMDPERDLMWRSSPKDVWPRYWSRLAITWHMTGEFRSELAITGRWRDSATGEWREIRGRALAALGQEREVRELLASGDSALESFATDWLRLAAELAAHGHQRTATAFAESVLTRLELEPDTGWVPGLLVEAYRQLGRAEHERSALERIAHTELDTLDGLEVRARIAVLSADTAQAERINSGLAEWSSRPLMAPSLRGSLILVRARIAAGLGRREEAVELLRTPRGGGSSPAEYHFDPLLAPLRGYPPFEALLKSDN